MSNRQQKELEKQQSRRRNAYVANCCACGIEVLAEKGWLYQDTQSLTAHNNLRAGKKTWKVKCETCHNLNATQLTLKFSNQEKIKRLSVAEVKKLLKEHGDKFEAVLGWDNKTTVVTFNGEERGLWFGGYNPPQANELASYMTGSYVADYELTDKAWELLDNFLDNLLNSFK